MKQFLIIFVLLASAAAQTPWTVRTAGGSTGQSGGSANNPSHLGWLRANYDSNTAKILVVGFSRYSSDPTFGEALYGFDASGWHFIGSCNTAGDATPNAQCNAPSPNPTFTAFPGSRHVYEQFDCDSLSHTCWLYGGTNDSTSNGGFGNLHFKDLWKLDTVSLNWTNVCGTLSTACTPTGPGQREETFLVYIRSIKAAMIYSGISANSGIDAKVWLYCTESHPSQGCNTLNQWQDASATSTGPAAASNWTQASGIYDLALDKVFVFGGNHGGVNRWNCGTNLSVNMYDVQTKTWTDISPGSGPPGVCFPIVVKDTNRGKYLFHAGTGNDWSFDPVTHVWAALSTSGGPDPNANGCSITANPCMTMAFDPTRDVFVGTSKPASSTPVATFEMAGSILGALPTSGVLLNGATINNLMR
jgi:hypothetical protein